MMIRYHNLLQYICMFAIAVTFIACNGKKNTFMNTGKHKNEKPVARAYSYYLYPSDLDDIVPKGVSTNDSIELVTNYINNWVSQKILLQKAEDNLSEDNKNFSEQIQQYRNSLLIFAYESELLRQKLDTVVSLDEIEKYYSENKDNFDLRDNIVQVTYVIAPKNHPDLGGLKKLLQGPFDINIQDIMNISQHNKFDLYVGKDKWMSFYDLLQKIPISIDNTDDFLKKNKFFEVNDNEKSYLVVIYKYMARESSSPLEFEKDNIRAVIINKRKAELLKKMQEDLFSDAEKSNKFEIYKYK